MSDIWQVLGLVGGGALLAVGCVLIGAFVTFKATRAVPGERFLGGVPKGQVFSIPDAETKEFPGGEERVLEKTKAFLERFGGA